MAELTRMVWVDRVKIDATSKNLEETDQYLLVKNVVLSRQGVFPYDGGKVFKSADELKAGAWTLEGAWIVAYQHPDSFVFDRDDIRGRSVNIRFDEDKAALVGDLRFEKSLCVKDKALLPGVKSGEMREVSVGFSSDDKRLPGTFGDEAYTFVQTRYLFDHVAIALTEGRCPAPFCGIALDSISDANFVQVELGKAAPGTFPPRVITWSEKEGILAAVGKRAPAADAEVLRYLFSKAKGWTLEKAQAWTKEHKDAAGELSEKELRARIVELENKRQEILDKLYPPPKRLPPAEERVLQLELNLIDGEVHALTEVLAEKLAGVEGSVGDGADKGKKPAAPDSEAKPCKCHLVVAREEVDRARRLLGSR